MSELNDHRLGIQSVLRISIMSQASAALLHFGYRSFRTERLTEILQRVLNELHVTQRITALNIP